MAGPLETLDVMMVDYLAVTLVDPSAVVKADQMVDWKDELSVVMLAGEMVDTWAAQRAEHLAVLLVVYLVGS